MVARPVGAAATELYDATSTPEQWKAFAYSLMHGRLDLVRPAPVIPTNGYVAIQQVGRVADPTWTGATPAVASRAMEVVSTVSGSNKQWITVDDEQVFVYRPNATDVYQHKAAVAAEYEPDDPKVPADDAYPWDRYDGPRCGTTGPHVHQGADTADETDLWRNRGIPDRQASGTLCSSTYVYKVWSTGARPPSQPLGTCPDPATTYRLTLSPGSGGSLGAAPDKTAYTAGEPVTVTATPDSDKQIASWGDHCAGTPKTSRSCSLTMNGNRTASVSFELAPMLQTARDIPAWLQEPLVD